MASRPVYYIDNKNQLKTVFCEFEWNPGFSIVQKQKNIENLHKAISDRFNCQTSEILEISSKSYIELGVKLSAFNLEVPIRNSVATVETLFQSSKVFEQGGPYTDLLFKRSIDAKKDSRLKESGKLIAFNYFGEKWSMEPKTLFYDWLYINAVYLNKELHNELVKYRYFTDIEFNPKKSLNCQAKSAAFYVGNYRKGILEKIIKDKKHYISLYKQETFKQETLL